MDKPCSITGYKIILKPGFRNLSPGLDTYLVFTSPGQNPYEHLHFHHKKGMDIVKFILKLKYCHHAQHRKKHVW